MFDLTNNEQCQSTSQARQRTQNERKPIHFGQSYDYFDQHRSLIQDEDFTRTHNQRKHLDWATCDGEVFCNVNALESDQNQNLCEREVFSQIDEENLKFSCALSNDSSRILKHQPTYANGINQKRRGVDSLSLSSGTYSWSPRSPHRSNSPDSITIHANPVSSGSQRQRAVSGTRYHPASPRADHHPSPTTPDEGYSTGTNSTTSISSPLSASLASIAFFDTSHPQGPPNINAGQGTQTGVKTNVGCGHQNSPKIQCRDLCSSNFPTPRRDLDLLNPVDKNPVIGDHRNRCNSEYMHPVYPTTPATNIMQRGPIQKGPSLNQLGRKALHTLPMPVVKRRDASNPHQRDTLQDYSGETVAKATHNGYCNIPSHSMSSLEDQIRSLTTIEEEDIATSDRQSYTSIQQPQSHSSLYHGEHSDAKSREREIDRNAHQQSIDQCPGIEKANLDHRDTAEKSTRFVEETHFFRAVPVQVLQAEDYCNVKSREKQYSKHWDLNSDPGYGRQQQTLYQHIATETSSADSAFVANRLQITPLSSHVGEHIQTSENSPVNGSVVFSNKATSWQDYKQFFEKDVNIAAHNIDPTFQKKLSNVYRNVLSDIDVNTHLKKTKRVSSSEDRLASDNTSFQLTSQIPKNDSSTRTANFRRQDDQSVLTNSLESKPLESNTPTSLFHNNAPHMDPPIYSGTDNFQNVSQTPHTQTHVAEQDQTVMFFGDSPDYYNIPSSKINLREQQKLFSSCQKPPHELPKTIKPQGYPSIARNMSNLDLTSIAQHQQNMQTKRWFGSETCLLDLRQQPSDHSKNRMLETNPPYLNDLCYQETDQTMTHGQLEPSHYQGEQQPCPRDYLPPYQGISELQYSSVFDFQPSLRPPVKQTDPGLVQMEQLHVDNAERTQSIHTNRASRRPDTSASSPDKGGLHRASQRSSIDLSNLPQLHKQFRASSELSLQTARRHIFASSGDIYKLFSSHRHRPSIPIVSSALSAPTNVLSALANVSQSTNQFSEYQGGRIAHRHSFHSTPSPSIYTALGGKIHQPPSLLDNKSSRGHRHFILHNQEPYNHQQMAHVLPSPSTIFNRHGVSDHISCTSSNLPTKTAQTFQTKNLASGMFSQPVQDFDLCLQATALQRQSSGYSSETELQQIEYNAKVGKKHFQNRRKVAKEKRVLPEPRNPTQEFIAHNTSVDQDSTTSAGTEESIVDAFVPIGVGSRRSHSAEPVYMNQIMLGRTKALHTVAPPLPSRTFRTSLANNQGLAEQHSYTEHDLLAKDARPLADVPTFFEAATCNKDGDNYPSQILRVTRDERLQQGDLCRRENPSPHEFHQQLLQHSTNSEIFNRTGKNSASEYTPVYTQHQVINFQNRPITVTSHIPYNSFTQEKQIPNYDITRQQSNTQSQSFNTINSYTDYSSYDANGNGQYTWSGPILVPREPFCSTETVSKSVNESHNQIFYSQSPELLDQTHGMPTQNSSDLSVMESKHPSNSRALVRTSSALLAPPGTERASSRSCSQPMSPVEIAQVLEIPFATNIISDEQGDRLSTLV